MSEINPLYRYGLQPGSALLLVALLESVAHLMSLIIDYGGLLANSLKEGVSTGVWEDIWLVLILLAIAATIVLLWYGVIFQGNKQMMIAWAAVTVVFFLIFLIIMLIIVFLDWDSMNAMEVIKIIYLVLFSMLITGYELHLALKCLPQFGTISNLEPIGKGWQFIIEYYKTHAREAASLVLMLEIILNTEIFLDRQVTRFAFGHEFMGHENDTNAAVLTEETILRYIRIGLCIIGFYLAYKEKKYWMLRWCLCYMATLACSTGIFIYLVFMWRAEHIILTLSYFAIFSVNLLYRTGILYICVRYTDIFERHGIPM